MLYDKWTVGISISGLRVNDYVALSTTTKLTATGGVAQLYTSYQFKEYLSFFCSVGILQADSYLTNPFQISKGHEISRGYTGSLGTIFIFPVIKKLVQPSFRFSTTRLEMTTNAYF